MDNKENKSMGKAVSYILCVIASLSFIVAMVVASVEINISNESFFITEYEKCRVDMDLGMDMEDIKEVSSEMMKYLYGTRDDLVVYTTLRGSYREFFNDREKAHMVDVKNMLQTAIAVRRIALVLCALCIAAVIAINRKRTIYYLSRGYIYTTAAVAAFFGGVYVFILINGFTEFWERFHGVFFTNDLWLLDPRTDMMILLLPEQFFSDLVLKSVMVFALIIVVLLAVATVGLITTKGNRKELPNPMQ
ncbi:MAG: TIGR01906 family membrane protein [Lachnospiraceae bacterium]|nr:TIGR01906 family membrane protein [Lachnospiraceae bacterium]